MFILPNPFTDSALAAAMPAEKAVAPEFTDPLVATAQIPADERRDPPGCPDADWCRGNRECYWDCKNDGESRFVLDEQAFLADIEPLPELAPIRHYVEAAELIPVLHILAGGQ